MSTASREHGESKSDSLGNGTGTVLGAGSRSPRSADRIGTVIGADSAKELDIGIISTVSQKRFRKVGSGKITVDSGAGESVCPMDMVPEEPIHRTIKNGTTYRAAGGQSLVNQGEKRIKFKSGGSMASLNFQAIKEVKKPLASAAKIANKGNLIVLDGDGFDSYILNKATKKKIPIVQENNVYVMDVDVMTEEGELNLVGSSPRDSEKPFQRQE